MKGIFNNQLGYGIEIEFTRPSEITQRDVADAVNAKFSNNNVNQTMAVESYNHITRPHWKITHDGSVSGSRGQSGSNEIVSRILKGQQGKLELKLVLEVLHELDCKVNVSCGLHVHHDVTAEMVASEKTATTLLNNLIKFVMRYEHFIYRLITPSRLSRGWCEPARKYFASLTGLDNNKATLKSISKAVFRKVSQDCKFKFQRYGNTIDTGYSTRIQSGRYCGLNLKNIWTRGSVEFRYHQGSLNFEKIWAWVVFTQAIVNIARDNKSIAFTTTGTSTLHFRRFKKALGFVCGTRCDDTVSANKVLNQRFAELKDRDRSRASNWHIVRGGV